MVENKNILIIGGSSGIGLALSELLASKNSVYVASRSNESLLNLDVNYIQFDATTDQFDLSLLPEKTRWFCLLSWINKSTPF